MILIIVFSGGDDDGLGPGEIGSEAVAGPSTSNTTDDPDDGETKPTVVASGGTWVRDGPPVDLNGTTPNCSWSDNGCR